MSKGKMNSITDPLGQQKTSAANLGLQNYQQASSNIPGLQQYFGHNFGQTPSATLGNLDPLFQEAYGSVQGDITGQGGPFTSLKKNLLGAFDTQATKSTAAENNQLQNLGLLGSGPGMSAQNDLASNLATQRGITSGNVDTQLLSMAQALSQSLMGYNQQEGFTNPMAALSQIYQLSQAPGFQDVNNSYYTPAPKSAGFQQGLGDVLAVANTVSGMMGGNPSSGLPASGGSSGITPNTAFMMPGTGAYNANLPGLQFAAM